MAIIPSVQSGFHGEHGWAVHLQQGKRHILLKGQAYGCTDEGAYWNALTEAILVRPEPENGMT
jgi:glycine cleavage system aminomethyltransferase T